MKEKKPSLVIALGMKPKPAKDVEAGGDPMGAPGLSAAADEVFDALQSGDKAAFAAALHAYVQMCDDDSSYEG